MCPWETFREVALSVIEKDCINEPLQSTIKGLSYTSSGDDGDDDRGYEDYKVILVTAAVSIVIFVAATSGFVMWKKKQHSEYKESVLSSSRASQF